MFTKLVATAATLVVAASLTLVGVASSASADTGIDSTSSSPSADTAQATDAPSSAPAPTQTPSSSPSAAPTTDAAPAPDTTSAAEPTPTTTPTAAATPTAPATEATCIPASAVTYSYDPATNSGDIVVPAVAGSTGLLCDPFWVTAASWHYSTDWIWPQELDAVDKLPLISSPGTYHFAAAVTCGQGDVYASTSAQIDPSLTPVLHGPGNPVPEEFLSDLGFTGPTPTWVTSPPSCKYVTPVAPTATAISSCGTYGSISVPADTASTTYRVKGSGLQGTYVVTATVHSPFWLADGATTKWTFDLGTYTRCAVAASSFTLGSCVASDGSSSKTVSFTFDNSELSTPTTFTVASTDISVIVPPLSTRTIVGPPVGTAGASFDVSANGKVIAHLVVPAFAGCLPVTPGDPRSTPAQCTEGVIGLGSIIVDLRPDLIYSIMSLDGTSTTAPTTSIAQVTTAETALPVGRYLVSVAAAPGFVLTGADSWPYTLTIEGAEDCGGLPTFSVQPVNVTSVNASCTTSGSNVGKGSITVGQVQGVDFTPFVAYAIDGVRVSNVTTAVAPGTHIVTAAAILPGDTLEQGPNTLADGTASWTVVITAAAAVCGDLTTLALPVDGLATTGVDVAPWLTLALLLMLAGAALTVARLRLARSRDENRVS